MDEILGILEDEVLDDLQVNGLKIFQKKQGFKFGMDAVLLAEFASKCYGTKVIDLGTGWNYTIAIGWKIWI